ncbi:MAG: sigma-54-dependent transcriptional regulator [Planctomycetota bacterium]
MDNDSTGPCRILVIDDEESLRHALGKGLTRAGYSATEAATGREGVDQFAAGGFDAVLTDLRLPDLGGLDLVAIFTEMDADVPVVVMTGYGSVDTALEAMRRGAKDYVQKPFSVEDVIRVLERAIHEQRLTHENRRLRSLVERRFAPAGYERVEAELKARRAPPPAPSEDGDPAPPPVPGATPLKEAQRAFEVRYVEDLLARTGGNIAAAARLAGISRPNFHKKLKTLGVAARRFKRAARRGRTGDL